MSVFVRLRTVRGRLTAWYTAVSGGLLLALGATAFVLLDRGLRENMDDSLRSVARAIAQSTQSSPGQDLADTLEGLFGPGIADRFIQLLDPLGRPDPRLPPRSRLAIPLSESALRNAEAGHDTFETLVIPRVPGGGLRLLTMPVIERGRLRHFVQVAMPLDRIEQARGRFLLVMLSLAPLALAATALGGWFLAGRALAPVDAMVATARRIGAEDLAQRIGGADRDDELGRLAAVLNDMLARLERAFDAARHFSADAAHELRTPLTILKGEIEVALRTGSLDPTARETLESCHEEVDRLAALVEDLLFLARADANAESLPCESVDLAALAADVAPALHALGERAGVAVAIDAPAAVPVRGSEPLLFRVLANLGENAIQYAGAGQQVAIAVRAHGADAVVEVRDTGPGIAEAERERIFRRFHRGDPSRARGGTGLGLPLVRSIVELHRGTVAVESEPGKGSVFRVRLPLERSGTG